MKLHDAIAMLAGAVALCLLSFISGCEDDYSVPCYQIAGDCAVDSWLQRDSSEKLDACLQENWCGHCGDGLIDYTGYEFPPTYSYGHEVRVDWIAFTNHSFRGCAE